MKYLSFRNTFFAAAVLSLLPGIAAAQTYLVDTGAGTNPYGGTSNPSIIMCAPCSPSDAFQDVAGQFTLSQTVVISSVQAWLAGTSGQGAAGKLAVVIHVDKNGIPGPAIWTQTYTLGSIAGSTGQWVPFPNYNAILPPGTYWLSFEPVVGSGLAYVFPTGAPSPLADYAQYNSLNTGVTWVSTQSDPYDSTGFGMRLLGAAFPGVAFGSGSRTAMEGTLFNKFPFGPLDSITGDANQARTLQWSFEIPEAIASSYGAIKANPNGSGNILTAGAYTATGSQANAAARGLAFAAYQNQSGSDQTIRVNTLLNGTMLLDQSGQTTGYAAVYAFDSTAFSNAIANAQASGLTAAQFLMNAPLLASEGGGSGLPPLPGSLIYSSGLLDSSGIQTVPFNRDGLASYSFSTQNGFTVHNGDTFVLVFDVMASSSGASSSSQGGQALQSVADFLDTLAPDPSVGLFTDYNTHAPITGIVGPAAVVIPPAPGSIVFSPASVTNQIGTQASVRAVVTAADATPVTNTFVRFAITSGPHAGLTGPVGTDAYGNATITLTDTLGQAGTDSIQITSGSVVSNTAQIVWTSPGALDHLTINPGTASISAGGSQIYSATGFDIFNNSLGDVTAATAFTIAPEGSCSGATCTAGVAGPHTVTGTDNGKTGRATLNVAGSQTTPTITWATPAAITFGTPLSATQLNAIANVPGAFVYSPALGTALGAGSQMLSVTFTPTDTTDYTTAKAQVTLMVNKATPSIAWGSPAAITYGTALSAAQLNATASTGGALVYNPGAGTILSAGSQTLSVTFTPSDTTDYSNASAQVSLLVNKATPNITWPTPAPIAAGTPLSATQLDATASVPGAFVYSPPSGTVLSAGPQTLSVAFTPTDTTNYATATATVSLTVNPTGKTTPIITWANPTSITYGTPLSGVQLDAIANVAGKFVYSPTAGTILTAGTHTLSATFTPSNTTAYTTATATVSITVNQVTPAILWLPIPIVYGSPLGPLQLDALTVVPGSFVYTPAVGAVLSAGNQHLTAVFTPKDTTDFKTTTVHATLVVLKALPGVHWTTPAAITAGTPLSTTQLDATANVSGTFTYNPAAGKVLAAGNYELFATFQPADSTDYSSLTVQVPITVKAKK